MTTVTTTIELRTAVVHDAAAPGSYCVPGPVQRTEARRLPPRLPRPVRMVPPQVGPCSKRHGPTWNCTGHPWRNVDSRLPQSNGGYQPRAASTASLTSRAASPPNTRVAPRSTLASGAASTMESWAGSSSPPSALTAHAAPPALLGLNGPRASEACESNIEEMAIERGHRVLRVVGKGNQPALILSYPHRPNDRPRRRRTNSRPGSGWS